MLSFIRIATLVVAVYAFASVSATWAYSILLPETMSDPPLPYAVEMDGWGGAACIQMVANSCPDPTDRKLIPQSLLWQFIQTHNRPGEPAPGWYSDPQGIEGTFNDQALSICGGWAQINNPSIDVALGKVLYWLKTKYLTPVSIGSFENWVAVCGYMSEPEPTSSSQYVTLNYIFFHNPNPPAHLGVVAGSVWKTSPAYWGTPVNRPGSHWHNNYVGVYEPPVVFPRLRFGPLFPTRGTIRPLDRIMESIRTWGRNAGVLSVLGILSLMPPEPDREPILVNKGLGRNAYYLLTYMLTDKRRLVMIVNAYNGKVEEMRLYPRGPGRALLGISELIRRLASALSERRLMIQGTPVVEYTCDPQRQGVDRYFPTASASVSVGDRMAPVRRVIELDTEGMIIRGID